MYETGWCAWLLGSYSAGVVDENDRVAVNSNATITRCDTRVPLYVPLFPAPQQQKSLPVGIDSLSIRFSCSGGNVLCQLHIAKSHSAELR